MSELKGSVKNHHQELYEEKTAGSMLCAKVELQHSLLHNVHSKLMDTVKKKIEFFCHVVIYLYCHSVEVLVPSGKNHVTCHPPSHNAGLW